VYVYVSSDEQQVLGSKIQSVRICLLNLLYHDWLDVHVDSLFSMINFRVNIRHRVVYQYDDVDQLFVEMHVNIYDIEMVWSPYAFDYV